MSSLWKTIFIIISKHRIKRKPSPTLQMLKSIESLAQGLDLQSYIKRIPLLHFPGNGRKEADSVPWGKHGLGGSMTVEAAVVIPMFLFFFLNLMSAIEMIRLHGNLELALWKSGRIMAVSGYAYDRTSLLSDLAVGNAVVDDVGRDYLEESPLTYGEKGLVFLESSYGEDDHIDVKVTYQVSPIFCIPGFKSFRMANRYYARAWTGYMVGGVEGEQGGEEVLDRVYVTPYGEVYHMSRDCSYLKRTISAMRFSEVHIARNSNGERYVLCRVCAGKGTEIVYVTQDGNRYHERQDCPNLKRTILTMERLAAEAEYRPCSKCVN